MDTLTKRDMAEQIIVQVGVGHKEATESIETFLEIVKETLEKGEPVSLSGFGKFTIREKKERRGRNPKTGEEIAITPRRSISFSLSNALRAKLLKED